jgi:Cft2 family RNA processing exonuclease
MNGSVLIPVFSLGKYQEILNIINNLKISCKIPNLTIYTAGLGQKINRLYDIYNYTTRRVKPGFEFTDIPVEIIKYDEALTGKYFRESSIVIVPSGMMMEGTLSFNLAKKWIRYKNFGVAFVGYLDPDSPSYSLAESVPQIDFIFGTKMVKRNCFVEKFRFSSHASRDEIINYITETKPGKLFITHGSYESVESLYKSIKDILPQTKIVIPQSLHRYQAIL